MKNTIKRNLDAIIATATIIAALGLVFNAASASAADCYLEIKVESMSKSKSGYLSNGEKVSFKQLEKFTSVCMIAKVPMTEEEIKTAKIANLKSKLAKLEQAKK